MSKLLTLTFILFFLALPASAQMRPGVYDGVHVTGSSGDATVHGLHDTCSILCSASSDVRISGTTAGMTLGIANAVRQGLWGVELQYSTGHVGGSGLAGSSICGDSDVCRAEVEDLTVLRIVLSQPPGDKIGNFMAIGMAGAHITGEAGEACPGPQFCGEGTAWGGTIAAGISGRLDKDLFWRAEYHWLWLPINGNVSLGYVGQDDFGYWITLNEISAGLFMQF